MQDIDKPRFKLELNLSAMGMMVDVDHPAFIDEKLIKQAWDMMNTFVMDIIDNLKLEVTDEEFRTMFIEVCYRLIYREMCTLRLLPIWEQDFAERLAKGKQMQRLLHRKGEEK